MTFFAVDDNLWGHPKWLATPPRARGLWTTAGSWCSKFSHDGDVPRHMLSTLGGTERDAAALVAAGMWETTRKGWRFHDWIDRNPDEATVKAIEAKKSEGGEYGNHVRWHVKRNLSVPSCAFCGGVGSESDSESDTDRTSESESASVSYRPNPNPIPKTDGETSSSFLRSIPTGPVDNSPAVVAQLGGKR